MSKWTTIWAAGAAVNSGAANQKLNKQNKLLERQNALLEQQTLMQTVDAIKKDPVLHKAYLLDLIKQNRERKVAKQILCVIMAPFTFFITLIFMKAFTKPYDRAIAELEFELKNIS